MADQCIVCLEELDVHPPPTNHAVTSEVIPKINSGGGAATSPHAGKDHEHQQIAVIKTCGHILHDVCLREWTQKANSCPICRQQFNLVEVRDTVTGPVVSEYTVEDKKQVAEFDPLAWIQEEDEEENNEILSRPCPICNSAQDEQVLLLCDGCDAPYHTYCVGLDEVPRGDWFCMECAHDGAIPNAFSTTPDRTATGRRRTERTQHLVRLARSRRRNRTQAWEGAWNQISTRIYDATDFDVDYDDDDMAEYRQAQRRTAQETREFRQWQQRLAIASRQGAREAFRNVAAPHLVVTQQPEPPRESEEVRRAWATYDRLREEEASETPNRKRKARSATSSPREPESDQPERKLKRPRTRRAVDAGSSSDAQARSSRPTERPTLAAPLPQRSPGSADMGAPPSFLSSLLKEVEQSVASGNESSDHEEQNAATNASTPAADHASSVWSPTASGQSSPRDISRTPPPQNGIKRSGSPLSLSSAIEPIYPPANLPAVFSSPPSGVRSNGSPSRSHSRPTTPGRSESRQRGKDGANGHATQPNGQLFENSPPSRLAELPLEAKEIIQKIVKGALDPHYKKPSGGITKEQYITVNRKVSHYLYDKISNPTALDASQRHRWERVAHDAVAKAVDRLTT